ncbi:efflux RND transporter periplasmic adaptor subunit [Roseobacter weihaiensis]|uniref:efflux RND transporter periplasmic adaptor subunit n=1 Tax=Roseobacter weihaiensis TaxID=2763262 RepID=UPI001D09FE0F|nr:efflux RND transporter periplasmic adaptor subunit [Roseobacter sp. H9]
MNVAKQVLATLALVSCSTLVAAHYSADVHTVLGRLGVPPTLLQPIARSDDQTAEANGARDPRGQGGRPAAIVDTAAVSTETISDTAQAIGSAEAVRSVSVVPFESGVLTRVAVTSGDMVAAGDLLAQLDAETEEIARDRAAVALRLAEAEYARYESLVRSNVASQTELDTLRAERDDAELALREADVALQRRSIFSPIGGVVGIVPVEMGDYVSTSTEIATVDDRSQVVVDFWLPERFVSLLTLGQRVTATPLAVSGTQFDGQISAIGSRVQVDSRTIQVRALIDNPEDLIRPGMSFSVTMNFDGETYPAVDPLAVNWDADGSYIWVVDDGVATRTSVEIIQRNVDHILIASDIGTGAQVVTEGGLNVRNGAPVVVQGDAVQGDTAPPREDSADLPAPSVPETEG